MNGHMENNMVERIVKLIQNLKEKLPKGDDVAKGTQEYKEHAHVDRPSITKPTSRGFILIMELIRDGPHGVSNSPILT